MIRYYMFKLIRRFVLYMCNCVSIASIFCKTNKYDTEMIIGNITKTLEVKDSDHFSCGFP